MARYEILQVWVGAPVEGKAIIVQPMLVKKIIGFLIYLQTRFYASGISMEMQ